MEPLFSIDTLLMFRELLGQLQVPASHPQLEALAAQIATARRELEAALEAATAPAESNGSAKPRKATAKS